MDLLGRLHAEGRTLLVVTHSAEVAAHAGRILHMHDGQIVGCADSGNGKVRPRLPLLARECGGYDHVAV
jgi:ABC-type lipoprotein export system ATPase subunit